MRSRVRRRTHGWSRRGQVLGGVDDGRAWRGRARSRRDREAAARARSARRRGRRVASSPKRSATTTRSTAPRSRPSRSPRRRARSSSTRSCTPPSLARSAPRLPTCGCCPSRRRSSCSRCPLLVEAPVFGEMADLVVAISAPEEQRIARAVAAGMSEADARDAGGSAGERRGARGARGPWSSTTPGSVDDLRREVERVWDEAVKPHAGLASRGIGRWVILGVVGVPGAVVTLLFLRGPASWQRMYYPLSTASSSRRRRSGIRSTRTSSPRSSTPRAAGTPRSKSAQGAVGLMQVLPSTAEQLARWEQGRREALPAGAICQTRR